MHCSDCLCANALRTNSDGLLKIYPAGYLSNSRLMGQNALGTVLSSAPDATERFFIARDIRASARHALLRMYFLCAREHNRHAAELKKIYPGYSVEELFQTARQIASSDLRRIACSKYSTYAHSKSHLPVTGQCPTHPSLHAISLPSTKKAVPTASLFPCVVCAIKERYYFGAQGIHNGTYQG